MPDLLVHEAALKETVVHIMCDKQCTIGQHVHDFLFVMTISLLDSEDDLIFCNISGEAIGKFPIAGIVSGSGSVNDQKCILPSPVAPHGSLLCSNAKIVHDIVCKQCIH